MQILSGYSQSDDATIAIKEATQGWDFKAPIGIIFVFHSTEQNPRYVAEEIARRFPGVPCLGCTTAGEYLNSKALNQSLVLSAVISSRIRWSVAPLEDLETLTQTRTNIFAERLMQNFNLTLDRLHPKRHFCVAITDGLSMKEEKAAALLGEAFSGISVFGGSSGDDLKFTNSFLIANGKCYQNASVVALAETTLPFHVLKHQHFLRSDQDLVVTEADGPNRIVITLDGKNAAQRYASLLKLKVSELNPAIFSKFPLTFSYQNEIYVRSIQQVLEGGRLKFYCAIEEGMVLEKANHRPMIESLEEQLAKVKNLLGSVQFFLGFNCILRGVEAREEKIRDQLQKLLSRELTSNSILFDTYGEQINGLHVNQTLVGIAFGGSVNDI